MGKKNTSCNDRLGRWIFSMERRNFWEFDFDVALIVVVVYQWQIHHFLQILFLQYLYPVESKVADYDVPLIIYGKHIGRKSIKEDLDEFGHQVEDTLHKHVIIEDQHIKKIVDETEKAVKPIFDQIDDWFKKVFGWWH